MFEQTKRAANWAGTAIVVMVGAVALIGIFGPKHEAEAFQASLLLDRCSRPDTQAACDAYILGIADGASLMWTISAEEARRAGSPEPAKMFCLPPTVQASNLRRTVSDWIADHPQERCLRLHELRSSGATPCEGRTLSSGDAKYLLREQ